MPLRSFGKAAFSEENPLYIFLKMWYTKENHFRRKRMVRKLQEQGNGTRTSFVNES